MFQLLVASDCAFPALRQTELAGLSNFAIQAVTQMVAIPPVSLANRKQTSGPLNAPGQASLSIEHLDPGSCAVPEMEMRKMLNWMEACEAHS
jgi:hypothetical protein